MEKSSEVQRTWQRRWKVGQKKKFVLTDNQENRGMLLPAVVHSTEKSEPLYRINPDPVSTTEKLIAVDKH